MRSREPSRRPPCAGVGESLERCLRPYTTRERVWCPVDRRHVTMRPRPAACVNANRRTASERAPSSSAPRLVVGVLDRPVSVPACSPARPAYSPMTSAHRPSVTSSSAVSTEPLRRGRLTTPFAAVRTCRPTEPLGELQRVDSDTQLPGLSRRGIATLGELPIQMPTAWPISRRAPLRSVCVILSAASNAATGAPSAPSPTSSGPMGFDGDPCTWYASCPHVRRLLLQRSAAVDADPRCDERPTHDAPRRRC